jgi:hypothetical protein
MNREYLEHVSYVKESLSIWLSNVEQLHNGIQMFSNENDLDRKNTDFAKWYFGEGQIFSSFETFRVLEGFYDEMYDFYINYNELREQPVKKGLFSNNVEKRKKELDALFIDVKKSTRKLIKSVEIFEENLKTSPLFEEAKSTIQAVEKPTESFNVITEEPRNINESFDDLLLKQQEGVEIIKDQEHIEEQFDENLIADKDKEIESKKSNTFIEENVIPNNESNFDFERRLQEEVEKIKEQLRQELQQKQEENFKQGEQRDTNIDNDIEKDFKPKTKSSQQTPDIDLDEEIRRILS